MIQKKWLTPRKTETSAFSMLEILIVIGIIGVLVAAGSFGFVQQMNRSRVESATNIVNSVIQQARQSAIAMRQARRVVFHAGSLDNFPDSLSGLRTERASMWVEGKICEEYKFDEMAWCQSGQNMPPNAYQVGDPVYLPDNVMIAGLDGRIPGVNSPSVFYIEFNSRGGVRKVYFQGEENSTGVMEIAAVIHLARDNETIIRSNNPVPYEAVINNADASEYRFEPTPGVNANERYKVNTIEVVRLTGKTRIYDFGYQDPWPFDEPKQP